MLKITAIGNIGNDAKIQQTKTGRLAITFSIAENRKWKNAEGITVEETTWLNCTIWKDQGQSTEVAKYLTKGTQVYIEGVPDVRIYTTKDGSPAVDFKATVNIVQLLGSKKEEAPTNQPAATPAAKQTAATPPPDAGPDHEYYNQDESPF